MKTLEGEFNCGTVWALREEAYLLTQVGANTIAMVQLSEGSNRFAEPVRVRSVSQVTVEEVQEASGCHESLEYLCVMPYIDVKEPAWRSSTVKTMMSSGNKVAAIKECRDATGWGLKESKDAVEQWGFELGIYDHNGVRTGL